MKGIALIGMPTSGKTSIGKILATQLKWDLHDIDDIVEEKEHMTHEELEQQKGHDYIIRLEGKTVNELNLEDSIVSTPGSIIYAPECYQHMHEQSHIVWLDVPLNVLIERLATNRTSKRVVIGVDGGIEKLFTERTPLYEELAEIRIDSGSKTPDEIAREILIKLTKEEGTKEI